MSIDDKRLKLVIILLLTIVFIVGSYFIFTQEISNIESTISTKATERANKINEKMVLIRSFIKTMRNNLQQYIVLQEIAKTPHRAVDLIKYYPENDASTIDEKRPAKKQLINGSFSADGKISAENPNRTYEISAAFYLDSTYQSALDSIPDLKWVYYLSKNNFAYTLPYIPNHIVFFDKNYYKKEYWTKAIPENNLQRRLVLTSVYKDSFGKGYLVTFSEPVYVDDEFRGIIGIDVSLDAFNLIMSMNMIIGDSFLLDENKVIIAASSEDGQGQILYIPPANFKNNIIFNAADGNDYVSYEIVTDEVIFVHRLNRELKYKVALFNSIRELFLLLSSVVMAYMIYYLRVFVFRVEQLANTDPLTSLLNRRAMESAVLPLMNVHQRYKQKMCFLLADIDYFKKVNDTHGHAVGDEILVSVTGILESCLRSSDLLSRHGGEEFLIALPQTDLESGSLLAERIRTSIENTRSSEHRVAVTISIGCIEVRENEGFDAAITRADALLYEAKGSGRNQSITSV